MFTRQDVPRLLYRARIWREYAQAWDDKPTSTGVDRRWMETHSPNRPRSECIQRARIALGLARRLNRLP